MILIRPRPARPWRRGFFRFPILGRLRAAAARVLGLVTAGLAAGGLWTAATWTSFAQGTLRGNYDPGAAIYQTALIEGRVPPGAWAPSSASATGLPATNVAADFAPPAAPGAPAGETVPGSSVAGAVTDSVPRQPAAPGTGAVPGGSIPGS